MSFFIRHLDSYCVRVGSLNVGTVAGRGRELGGYAGNEKCCSVVCVRNWMEGEQSEIVGEAASCSVVVKTNKSGMVWG